MHFSVIIPTYNPRKYLYKLLDSINTNLCKDSIEVIIADDLSDEDFSDILSSYKSMLNIKVVKNKEHHGAPAYGRQNGSLIAEGDWICFADQDDWFTDHAFDEVKAFIEETGAENYIVSDFYMMDDDGNETLQEKAQNWTHGKFYEKKFWKDANISYNEVQYCEDIGLSVRINCELIEREAERYYFNHPTYVWYQHDDSLSNASKYTEKGYFFKSFPDYIKITLGTYVERYEKASLNDEVDFFYRFNISSVMMYMYFYFQGMNRRENFCPKIPKEYYISIYGYFLRFLKISGFNNYKNFVENIYRDKEYLDEFTRARYDCVRQIPFVETETFEEWLVKLPKRARKIVF